MADIGLTNPQPARALNEEKARFALRTQWAYQAMNSAGACQFVFGPGWQLIGMEDLAGVIAAVTGWDLGVEELLAIGERTLNLQRAFNAREGFTREQDTLPRRFFDEPLQGGAFERRRRAGGGLGGGAGRLLPARRMGPGVRQPHPGHPGGGRPRLGGRGLTRRLGGSAEGPAAGGRGPCGNPGTRRCSRC